MNPPNTRFWLRNRAKLGRRLTRVRARRREVQKAFFGCFGICLRAYRDLEKGNYDSPQILLQILDFLNEPKSVQKTTCNPAAPLCKDEVRRLGIHGLCEKIFGPSVLRSKYTRQAPLPACSTIGNCVINFHFLVGGIENEQRDIRMRFNWEKDPFVPASDVAQFLWGEKFWIQKSALESRKTRIYFRPLGKPINYTRNGNQCSFDLQPTDYLSFAATNLNLQNQRRGLTLYGKRIQRHMGRTIDVKSGYLASPVNVICMLVSSDQYIFDAKRTATVYERPLANQASVGGAVEFGEQPQDAVIRETKEEFGIAISDKDIHFVAAGINQISGEPDLLAIVNVKKSASQIQRAFKRKATREEFKSFRSWKLKKHNLETIVTHFHKSIWSQPSDRAIFLLTLIRKFKLPAVKAAFERLIDQPCSDDQRRHFRFVLNPKASGRIN